ncbi:glucan biosynthesis protein G [Salipiger sp. IMCC34102]|nr:glucan biosynthesis protein G [Salipiger sp. IMCC34102]
MVHAPVASAQDREGAPFSFDALIERARAAAAAPDRTPEALGGPFAKLDYDTYRQIQFNEETAVWADRSSGPVVHAYHPGWLFDATVRLNEVEDGLARPLDFTAANFDYYGEAAELMTPDIALPGVAGFKVNAALNDPDRLDEVLSFLGASYFRALGQGNRYGLSARGLAVNTATGGEEEFPRFSEFWLERGQPEADAVTIHALLESQSVTGAYRFVVTPGQTTTIDVTLRLFFRRDIDQLGVAPLTSMFLFGPNDEGPFEDYRTRVHDSEALLLRSGETSLVRPLNNPPRLGNSYLWAQSPRAFGLIQRHRRFEDYLDAGAHYEARPSLMVEPSEDWGRGSVRLIEIPSDLEANDNIVAFWVPERAFKAGDAWGTSYRLHWGMSPPTADTSLARISRTLAGFGGFAGVEPLRDQRKFVIDFEGGALGEPDAAHEVTARTVVTGGRIVGEVLERLDADRGNAWRLVLDVKADPEAIVELKAELASDDRVLTETWIYQWMTE